VVQQSPLLTSKSQLASSNVKNGKVALYTQQTYVGVGLGLAGLGVGLGL